MTRNFKKETAQIREQAAEVLQTPLFSRQSTAVLMLAVIKLGILEKRIRTTNSLTERKEAMYEFDSASHRIRKAIQDFQHRQERTGQKRHTDTRRTRAISA